MSGLPESSIPESESDMLDDWRYKMEADIIWNICSEADDPGACRKQLFSDRQTNIDATMAERWQTLLKAQLAAYDAQTSIAWKEYAKAQSVHKTELKQWNDKRDMTEKQLIQLNSYICKWLDMCYVAVPATPGIEAELPVSIPYGGVPVPPTGYEFIYTPSGQKQLSCYNKPLGLAWAKTKACNANAGSMSAKQLVLGTKASWYLVFTFTDKSANFFDTKIRPTIFPGTLPGVYPNNAAVWALDAIQDQWRTMLFGRTWNSTFDMLKSPNLPTIRTDTWAQLIPYWGDNSVLWAPVLRQSLMRLQYLAGVWDHMTKIFHSPGVPSPITWVLPWGCKLTNAGSVGSAASLPPAAMVTMTNEVVERQTGSGSPWIKDISAVLDDHQKTPSTVLASPYSETTAKTSLASSEATLSIGAAESKKSMTSFTNLELVATAKWMNAKTLTQYKDLWWFLSWMKYDNEISVGTKTYTILPKSRLADDKPVAWPWWWGRFANDVPPTQGSAKVPLIEVRSSFLQFSITCVGPDWIGCQSWPGTSGKYPISVSACLKEKQKFVAVPPALALSLDPYPSLFDDVT